MARITRLLGRTRIGLWLWRQSRAGRGPAWLGRAVGGLTGALAAAERAALRRWPAHRRHDRRQAALLAAFEAETRAGGRAEDRAGPVPGR